MEDRSSGRINVMAAMLADEGAALTKWMKLGVYPTAGTHDFGPAIVHFHELREAVRVGRINFLKLLEGVLGHD